MTLEKPLTPKEAAEILQVHPKSLVKWAREGKVPGKQIGTVWRFLPSQLDAFLRGEDWRDK